MLYAYFLEVAKDVTDRVFIKKKVPRDASGMYGYFFKENVLHELSLFEVHPKEDERFLWHNERKVNLEKLDCLKSLHIIEILERKTLKARKKKPPTLSLIQYLIELRNFLCHLALKELEKGMSQEQFMEQWEYLTDDFKYHKVDKRLLETCKRNIYAIEFQNNIEQ